MGRWPQIVGEDLAKHCVPERYDEDERVLTVQCDSTAWATQLRLLAPQLVARLNEDLGHGTVKADQGAGPGGSASVATAGCGPRAARVPATPTGDGITASRGRAVPRDGPAFCSRARVRVRIGT